MERPGILKSVLAVFVFLAAFLTVANFLGGGTPGLVAAGVIAVIAVVVYLIFYGWIARLPMVRRLLERESEPNSAPKNREEAVPSVQVRKPAAQRKRLHTGPDPPEPDRSAVLARGVRNVCDPGPYDVEPGRPTKIPLEVERGFTLVGTLEEKDGDDFEFMIVDEDNWVRYQQGLKAMVQDESKGEGIYKIGWKVPSGGPWFLILEAYGKQLVRVVSVNLRLSGGH